MLYSSVPNGFEAIRLECDPKLGGWTMAVVVRKSPSHAAGLVTLCNLPDQRAYLGCLLDGQGIVRVWTQIWVQNLEGFVALDTSLEHLTSSESLDLRWRQYWNAFRATAPHSLLLQAKGDLLRPLFIDPRGAKAVHPEAPDGRPWVLCRDDERLGLAQLPRYADSTWRFLEAPGGEGASVRFVAADRMAPKFVAAPQPSPELGFDPSWLPLNPQGSNLAIRVHPPMDLADYADLLSGATVEEIGARKQDCEAAVLRSQLTMAGYDGIRHGLLLSDFNGAEVLYLKLRLLLQVARSVLHYHRHQQSPLLNLDPASFGVFPGTSGELPWPWTTNCELMRPGRAFSPAIPGAFQGRFLTAGPAGLTAYCPGGHTLRGNLNVTIWIDRVIHNASQEIILEGRIAATSPVQVSVSDMVRFRLSEGPALDDFFATPVLTGSEWMQEIEFRSQPRLFDKSAADRLKEFGGGKVMNCFCEFIPTLNSPYDLYSLSALGARILLAHANNPLAKVITALERVGRAAGKQLPGGGRLADIIPAVARLMAEPPAAERLDVTHLFGTLPDAPTLSRGIPEALWAETLTLLLRWMPGLGPVSLCADVGAVPEGAVHLPLEESIVEWEHLCGRARSLLFSDWSLNFEARAILEDLRST